MDPKDSILIVDDDPDIRQLLVDYLARNGFDAKPAGSGREMAQVLDKHAIDLVVLDLMLPDADGLLLCRDLRAKSNLPVLMLTARGRGGRPHPRHRDGRRRLPGQALQPARAAGAHQGHPAPHAFAAAQPEAGHPALPGLRRLEAGHRHPCADRLRRGGHPAVGCRVPAACASCWTTPTACSTATSWSS
jgi:CheY-like chemotaxis protein